MISEAVSESDPRSDFVVKVVFACERIVDRAPLAVIVAVILVAVTGRRYIYVARIQSAPVDGILSAVGT